MKPQLSASLACLLSVVLTAGCGNGSGVPTSTLPVEPPSSAATVEAGVLQLSEPLDPRYAGELRFSLSNVVGSLPESFTIQGATFVLLDDGTQKFYAADLGSLFKDLMPFSQITLPGVQSATIEVIQLPVSPDSSTGTAPIYQDNARLVTLQDVALVLALQQLGGSPTAAQLATQASTLLGTPIAASSLNPVPNSSNADYAKPAGSVTLSDVAVVQAAFFLLPADRRIGALAAVATQLMKATPALTSSDVLKIPGISALPPVTPGLTLNPTVGAYPAANLAFSVTGSLVTQTFTVGSAPNQATFTKLQSQFPGYSTYVAEQGSAFVQLAAFRNVAIPGLASSSCVIVHAPNQDPSQVANWISRTAGCRDPRALDIVVSNSNVNTVSVLSGIGNGSFQAQQTFAVGVTPSSATLANLNGDNHLDLATTNYNSDTVSILLGNGNGTFQPQQTVSVGDGPQTVELGDVNGDGIPDLVVANFLGDTVSILLGNGNGTFQPQTTYATADGPASIGLADVNGNASLDLVIANRNNSNLSVLLGNGNGTFLAQQTFAAGSGPSEVVLGDLNGDSKIDVAVSNFVSNTVSTLLGNGNGTFQTQQTFAVGLLPNSIALGDMNGDGKLDVAVANRNSDTVSVLVGNGDGTLQAQQTFTVGDAPFSLALGDVNGDAILDLAVANLSSDHISVLLGNGNGSFSPQQTFSVGDAPTSLVLSRL